MTPQAPVGDGFIHSRAQDENTTSKLLAKRHEQKLGTRRSRQSVPKHNNFSHGKLWNEQKLERTKILGGHKMKLIFQTPHCQKYLNQREGTYSSNWNNWSVSVMNISEGRVLPNSRLGRYHLHPTWNKQISWSYSETDIAITQRLQTPKLTRK